MIKKPDDKRLVRDGLDRKSSSNRRSDDWKRTRRDQRKRRRQEKESGYDVSHSS